MNPATTVLTAMALVLALATPGIATELVVAAASDLSSAAKDIVADFQKKTGHTVKLSLGSSGNFHAQIVNGAPFDIFLSADLSYARDLEKQGLAETESTYIYAIGRIVLWVPKSSPLDIQTLGMKTLTQPQARRIAIANPEHAPYGRAAVAAMRAAGVYESIKSRLVLGENISQAAQFVQSGAADIGIVALSSALSEPMKSQGKYWQIPVDSYPRMEQAAIILKQAPRSRHDAAAREFLEFLRSPDGRAILQRYGFSLPAASGAER